MDRGVPLILSVDDDPINQIVMEDMMTHEGFLVKQCMNGHDALTFLAECSLLPDLILLDVMMPDMNGLEVCRIISERYTTVSIPIIMVSAKTLPEDIMEGLQAGSVDYIRKPYHRQELLGRVRAQLRNRMIIEEEVKSRKVVERLQTMLPLSSVERLQVGQSMIADVHSSVTILLAETVFSWPTNAKQPPKGTLPSSAEVVLLMNEMHQEFERILEKHGVFRADHSGGTYMVVSGHDGCLDHTDRILAVATEMQKYAESHFFSTGEVVPLRIGIHCGPAYAGVVCMENPRYCVFGEAVLVASTLSSGCPSGTIHVSHELMMACSQWSDNFVKYMPSLTHGSTVVETYLCKVGPWEEALKELADGDKKQMSAVAELERKLAASEAAREAQAAQLHQLTGERAFAAAGHQAQTASRHRAAASQCDAVEPSARLSAAQSAAARSVAPAVGSGVVGVDSMPGRQHNSPTESFVSRSTLAGSMPPWGAPVLCSLADFLVELGLSKYETLLAKQELTPLMIGAMTDAQLQSIGVTAFGARKRILEAATDYKDRIESATMMALLHQDANAQLSSRSDMAARDPTPEQAW